MDELSNVERDHLLELLQKEHGELLHQIHHTSTRSYEEILRKRLGVNEALLEKLDAVLV